MSMNRLHNTSNPFQGKFKKVLCVCSAGLLRSPTAAWVLSQAPFDYNTRACGASSYHALIALDAVQLSWCDEVVVMETWMEEEVRKLGASVLSFREKPVVCLDIPDEYAFRDPELIELIKTRYAAERGVNNVQEKSI